MVTISGHGVCGDAGIGGMFRRYITYPNGQRAESEGDGPLKRRRNA